MNPDLPTYEIPREGNSSLFAHGCTDVGRVRESNQDSFFSNKDIGLFLVADGMGGRAGGEVASQLAAETIASEVERNWQRITEADSRGRLSFFSSAINKASLRIYERSLELPQYRGMGTTATVLWLTPGAALTQQATTAEAPLGTDEPSQIASAVISHVGDSRCYLCRAGLLFQLTDDHSLVNEQIKAGVISRRDPMISQIRNVITRCVGYQEEEEVDTLTLEVMPGDRFLLCSDGLSTKVTDEEIRTALMRQDLTDVPEYLTELANERGGDDNITVLVVST